MKEKLAELPGGVEQSKGRIAWQGDVFDQVINKPERCGKVRGVGFGVFPSSLRDKTPTNQSSYALSNDDASNEQVENLVEERIKVIQESHNQAMKNVLERQAGLEKKLSKLIEFLIEKASNAEETDMSEQVSSWHFQYHILHVFHYSNLALAICNPFL